ncbi:MAG: hypothetical protein DRO40_11225 [Thermoprotei archaeon]|nr:MAG: hypothetical protein DRO40_11225 [Thermoprotei archaeon]
MSKGVNISHVPVAYIELEVRDKNGKLIKKHRQPAHSWVKNFMNILRYGFANHDVPCTKQDGSTVSITINASLGWFLRVTAGAGDDSHGLMVGNGSKAFEVDDYSLDSKIPHGSNANQLVYGETTVENVVDDGSKLYFRIIRTFSNNSGSSITVTEVGLAVAGADNKPLIARDVLDSPVTVPNGGTLTVRYIIQYQYA